MGTLTKYNNDVLIREVIHIRLFLIMKGVENMSENISYTADKSKPNELLMLLLLKNNTYLSGEEISKSFGVSRTAIWKQINALRDMGYNIKSSPRLGYQLEESPDRLFPEEIWSRKDLSFIGNRIYYISKTGSTNEDAKKLAQQGAPHGTLVLAEKQEKGKGRLKRPWISPQGGIWLSIILRPDLSPEQAPKLTMLSAVAVADVIREGIDLEAFIKWPNDILIEGKKVCGILTEMSAEIDMVNYVIIGIGINVNNTAFPQELENKSTSLKLSKGEIIPRADFLAAVLEKFEYYYKVFEARGFEEVLKKWRLLCGNLGKPVRIFGRNDSFEGVALDIDEDGALLVKKDDGSVIRVLSGDVSLR